MKSLRKQVAQAAHSSSTVLISGETGTGKELVAHSIHNLSNRRKNPFVYINASTLPENLIESELFGYEPGAFTGANKEGKKGKFELAHTGTLFIDEIDQMSLHLQPKILRAIQEKEIDRVSGIKSIPVDIRILVATNKNLKQLVKEGKFREDLFFRLNVVEINTPPLREHLEDLPLLTENIVQEFNRVMGKRVSKVDPAVLSMFASYDWPGNVRELRNVMERAMNDVESGELLPAHFRFKQVIFEKIGREGGAWLDAPNPISEIRDYAERELLLRILSDCKGNKTKASEALKISRPLLYKKMKRLRIDN
jgi:transcriptional regulator with PAS, ATPase and Fis domain